MAVHGKHDSLEISRDGGGLKTDSMLDIIDVCCAVWTENNGVESSEA